MADSAHSIKGLSEGLLDDRRGALHRSRSRAALSPIGAIAHLWLAHLPPAHCYKWQRRDQQQQPFERTQRDVHAATKHIAMLPTLFVNAGRVLLDLWKISGTGGIGLTKSGALNRAFATWAAERLEWPKYTSKELFEFHKVLSEPDVLPLAIVHRLLV